MNMQNKVKRAIYPTPGADPGLFRGGGQDSVEYGEVAKGHLGESVGGVSPPTGGVWGATPRKIFKNQPLFPAI